MKRTRAKDLRTDFRSMEGRSGKGAVVLISGTRKNIDARAVIAAVVRELNESTEPFWSWRRFVKRVYYWLYRAG